MNQFTNLPNGMTSFGIPQVGSGGISIPRFDTGRIFFVDPLYTYTANFGGQQIFPTFAKMMAGLNDGDTIYVFPGSYEEAIVITKNYVTIIGAQWAGYARPDIEGTSGVVPLTVEGHGFRAINCRFAGTAADAVLQRGNGFSYEGCVFDGDLTAAKCGLRLKPSDTDDSFTASEGQVVCNLFRGSAFGVGFDTGAASVGVGSTDNLIQGNIFDRNTLDIAALNTGVGVYSVQFAKILDNQFMDPNKAVYIDMLTTNGGGAGAQSGIINRNDFATNLVTSTNVKIAGTGFMFISNEDVTGVINGINLGGGVVQGAGPANISLASAAPFAIIARATVTDANPSIINGDVGLAPGTSQGIPPSEVNGTIHVNDAIVLQAQLDLQTAYLDAASRTGGTLESELGTLNLPPGLYTSATSMLLSTGDLTLTGGPNDVWIFQMGTTFTQNVGNNMILAGGARARNVHWQMGSSATIGANCIAKGNFMSAVSSTVVSGAVVEGRVFAGSNGNVTGAVTVDANTISIPTL